MCAVLTIPEPAKARRFCVVLLALVFAASACGGDDDDEKKDVKLPTDAGGPIFVQDSANVDASDEVSETDAGGQDDLGSPDLPVPDTGPICTEFGCDCQENSDCDSGQCIDSPGGQMCTKICTETCPEGYKCVTAGAVDGVSICVPKFGNICAPCKENSLCQTTGSKGGKCVDRGAVGAFCGTSCQNNDDCPANYKCDAEAKDVTGEQVSQCVLIVGSCACSKVALAQEWATTCSKTIGDAVCQGERMCLADGKEGAPPGGGLTGCIAKEPEAEVCDGKDNDCDAETDEATCEDDNACTQNDCGGDAGCLNSNQAGPCNYDDSVCTVDDACADGKCAPGKAKVCDDGNPCTTDTCVADKGCVYEASENGPCDADDNPCTVNDACAIDKDSGKGVCKAGAPKACDSGGPCNKGSCSPSTGKCAYTAQDGFPCDDGNPCSVDTVCEGELCKGKPNVCDDGLGCTADKCDAVTGCAHDPIADGNACDDGDPCTVQSACDGGACKNGKPNTCDDANDCTKDGCAANVGCGHEPLNASPCDDGNICTGPDACDTGVCKAGGDLCVCKTNQDCAKLEDGDLCNGTLICKEEAGASKCVVDAATVVKCDDGNPCTKNSCDKQSGKCATENLQTSCDDKNVCTDGDKCGLDAKTNAYGCVPGAQKNCDDSVDCTVDTCDTVKGCQNVSAVGKDVACYGGPPGSAGKGKCKAGLQTCKPDGTLTACIGEVKPDAKEICGNKVGNLFVDDNCDGKVDEGCGPDMVYGHMASGTYSGKAGNLTLRGSMGASSAAGPAVTQGNPVQVDAGFYSWLLGF